MGVKIFQWHLLAVGIWTGCIATEVIFERVMQSQSKEIRRMLAKVHYYVDLAVEIPAAVITFLTGAKMISNYGGHPGNMLATKVVVGTVGVIFNFACFRCVQKRYYASLEDDQWEEYEANDKLQHRVGHGVVHSVLVALGLGLAL